MKIQFVIRERLSDIVDQLSNSDFWATEIQCLPGKKIIRIKDHAYDLSATAEVLPKEIVIHTAWSNFTYRIFQRDGKVCCEYEGAFRGLLDQKLLPHLTPVGNILDYVVLESALYQPGEQKTLREYARDNERQRSLREHSKASSSSVGGYADRSSAYGFAHYMKEDLPSS